MSSLPVTALRRRLDWQGATSTLAPVRPGFVPRQFTRINVETEAPPRHPRPFRPWPLLLADLAAVLVASYVLETWMSLVALAWLPLVATTGGYEPSVLRTRLGELRWVAAAGSGLVAIGVGLAALHDPASSRDALLVCVATVLLSVLLRVSARIGIGSVVAGERRRTLRVLVAGRRRDVVRVVAELRRTRGAGVDVVGACLPPNADAAGFDFPVTHGFDAMVGAARRDAVDAVIVIPSKHLDVSRIRQLRWDLDSRGTLLLVAPGVVSVAETRTRLSSLGTMPLVHLRRTELAGPRHLVKGCWERSAAFLGLLVALPLLALVAIAIRYESPGPALFRQVRVGRDGRTFTMYKLRTMTEQAEAQLHDLAHLNEAGTVLFKVREDPRVTRIGRILRRYSLDELPQLANIVLGQMALVGPRPPLPCEVARYDEATRRRLLVKPGLTGLWQVSGRSDLPWREAVRLDLEYVDNWSLALDLWITSRTFRAVLSHRGAY